MMPYMGSSDEMAEALREFNRIVNEAGDEWISKQVEKRRLERLSSQIGNRSENGDGDRSDHSTKLDQEGGEAKDVE